MIRRDPAGRGLLIPPVPPWCRGSLLAAADSLIESGRGVAICTGFFIPRGTPPAAETDGPLGAAILAAVLRRLGIDVWFLTDPACRGVVQIAAEAVELLPSCVEVAPLNDENWYAEFWSRPDASSLTHLVSIERVGASHTLESLCSVVPPEVLDRFSRLVKPDDRGRRFNMRGDCIDAFTSPLDRLFLQRDRMPDGLKTIGIGDGGNEIGLGSVPFPELFDRLDRFSHYGAEVAARTICRVPTDFTILAGVSNWGGTALAGLTAYRAGRPELLLDLDTQFERTLLDRLVETGTAVDGVTGRAEASVDGLPFETYAQTWLAVRHLLLCNRSSGFEMTEL
jgi:hypothetical protein